MAAVPASSADGDGPAPRQSELRIATLLLIAEEPLNGYELINVLAERTEGRWRVPSATIYPLLEQLAEEGLIRLSEAAGWSRQRPFEITDAGRAHLHEHGGTALPWEAPTQDGTEPGPAAAAEEAAGTLAPSAEAHPSAAPQPVPVQQADPGPRPDQEPDAPTTAPEPGPKDRFASAMAGFSAAADQMSEVGTGPQLERASRLLAETKRGLYRILADDDKDDAEL